MSRRDLLFVGCCAAGALGLAAYLSASNPGTQPSNILPYGTSELGIHRVVAQVDAEFADHWSHSELTPAPPSDNLTICRRISLALTGTVPSLEEIRQLDSVDTDQQVAWWIAKVLSDRRSADYLAERLARAFVGVEDGPFIVFRRRRFVTWLSDQLSRNLPYDQLVRQLITSEGLWTDSPPVNFLTVTSNPEKDNQPDQQRLAGRTSRTFLGVRLDCVQCHDDHLDGDWMQSDFHELAAFYSDARSSLVGIKNKPNDYRTKYLHADKEQIVPPAVPFAEELFSTHGSRRQQLANWVTHNQNRAFARAVINRSWALLFGRPLVEPVDDIPLAGPYPPGMDALTDDFLAHGCDLRRLWTTIVSTRVFQIDSRAPHEITARHEQVWAAFPLSRLRPEQVAGAMVQSARLRTIDANSHILVRLGRLDQSNKFVERYGDTGEDEFGSHGGTIPQRLLLMNGELVKDRTKEGWVNNAAMRIASLSPNDEQAIESAFLAVLTRGPALEELTHFSTALKGKTGKVRQQFFEDLHWVLLNSTEFSWNH